MTRRYAGSDYGHCSYSRTIEHESVFSIAHRDPLTVAIGDCKFLAFFAGLMQSFSAEQRPWNLALMFFVLPIHFTRAKMSQRTTRTIMLFRDA
jgi:hypothetical protein